MLLWQGDYLIGCQPRNGKPIIFNLTICLACRTVDVYSPTRDQWEPGPAMPPQDAMSFVSGATIGRHVYIVGEAAHVSQRVPGPGQRLAALADPALHAHSQGRSCCGRSSRHPLCGGELSLPLCFLVSGPALLFLLNVCRDSSNGTWLVDAGIMQWLERGLVWNHILAFSANAYIYSAPPPSYHHHHHHHHACLARSDQCLQSS